MQLLERERTAGKPPQVMVPAWKHLVAAARLDWGIASMLGVLGVAIHLYRVGGVSLWYDEAFSVGLARQPLAVLWQHVWGTESNMVLYYALLHAWLRLIAALGVQGTELLVHLPSAMFVGLSVAALFLFGRRFWGRTAGLVGATLYLINYLQLYEAGDARSYGLQLLLITLSWYSLLTALSSQTNKNCWWASFTATTALAIYAHLFSALVLAAQLATVGWVMLMPGRWYTNARRSLRPLVLSLAGVLALVTPLAYDVLLHGGPNAWIRPATVRDIPSLFGFISGPVKPYFLALVLGGALAMGAHKVWRQPSRQTPSRLGFGTRWLSADTVGEAIPLLSWFAVPIALSYVLTQPFLNLHLFLARYLVVVVPPLCLLAGLGVSRLSWRPAKYALAAGLLLLAIPAIPKYYATVQKADFITASGWLEQQYQAGDGVVCFPVRFCDIPMDYYLQRDPQIGNLPLDAPGGWSWTGDRSTPIRPETLAPYGRKHSRIFFIAVSSGVLPDAIKDLPSVRQWLEGHYRASSQFVSSTATITMYTAGPGTGGS